MAMVVVAPPCPAQEPFEPTAMNHLSSGGTGRSGGMGALSESVAGSLPFVSVVMPVYNEERFIAHTLATVFEQDYPLDRFEVIVADGMSSDRTRQILNSFQESHANLRVIDNPGRIVSSGLNRAVDCARGELIIRLDGHNVYATDFIRRVVKLSQDTGADNAGGVLVPTGNGYVGESIAAAYHSPLGIGGAQRGHFRVDEIRQVDTVHGGCWRRERLIAVGKFDEEMVRNQDDELSFRIRKSGGIIVQSTAIRIQYWVRDSYRKLFWQFAQYGYWKVKVVRRHPRQASLRHFIPALFLVSLAVAAISAFFSTAGILALIGLAGVYFAAILLAGLKLVFHFPPRLLPGIMLSLLFMQVGYGWGSLMGLRRLLTGPIPTDGVFERGTR